MFDLYNFIIAVLMDTIEVKSLYGILGGVAVGFGLGWLINAKCAGKPKRVDTKDDDDDDEGEWSSCSEDEGDLTDDVAVTGKTYKMVMVVRQDLKMGKGKIAAQCSHASLGCYKQAVKSNKSALKAWEYCGQPKVVVKCKNEEELMQLYTHARAVGVTTSLIRDAGRTQISPGSKTVLGVGPSTDELVDKVTGHLKLQ